MSTAKPKRMALKLLLLLIFFIAPMVAAILVYQARNNLHFLSKNVGELIVPSIHVEEIGLDPLDQRWYMAYYGTSDCDQNCEAALQHFNTMFESLIKDQHRLGLVFLTEQENPAGIPGSMKQLEVHTLREKLPRNVLPDNQDSVIWIIDPIGNIILSYDPKKLDNAMLIDLRHLLKVSQIG